MYVSLYRRYRPQRFEEVVGQGAAVDVLRTALAEARIGHAYLFSGPRGCGKTTAARLVAKTLNCERPVGGEPCCTCDSCLSIVAGKHLDVIEIDGASNRGIDEIRELKSHVNLSPFMGHKKIYIIDEAHMLTDAASNALLKTLEEPPAPVVFILATTESHKVSVTIRSRCQHIPFHRIGAADMVAHLAYLAEQEGVQAEERALWELARAADGALRDALSLMEQVLSAGKGSLSMQCVRELMGGGSRGELEEWVGLLKQSPAEASARLMQLLSLGISPERFLDGVFTLFRDLWLWRLWGASAVAGLALSPEEQSWLQDEAPQWEVSQLQALCSASSKLMPRVRYGMRIEVFSGLLQLAFADILQGRTETEAPPLFEKKQEHVEIIKKTTEIQPDKAMAAEVINLTKEEGETIAVSEIPQTLNPLFAKLWAEDLPLCAALLRAKILQREDTWVLDSELLSKIERTTLESGRASSALSNAIEQQWGIVSAQSEKEESAAEAPVFSGFIPSDRPSVPQGNRGTRSESISAPVHAGFQQNSSVEQLAAYLEAEVLLIKPKIAAPGDLENGAVSADLEEEVE